MPSVSKTQQHLFGIAWALRSGEISLKDVNPRYKKQIKSIADGKMTDKELKNYASTKAKSLPEKVKKGKPVSENEVNENESLPVIASKQVPSFTPKIKTGTLINISPFIKPDSQKEKPGKGNMENLKDYRDWIKK